MPSRVAVRLPWLVAGAHTGLALVCALFFGVTIVHDFGPDVWGWFLQNIATDLLLARPLESLWYLHAQPPLWNALGALLIHAFGPYHMGALHFVQMGFGAATAGLVSRLVLDHTGSARLAAGVGLAVAFHPALILFEAYALYTVLVAFLVVWAAYLASRSREAPGAAVGFVGVVTALVLTRSVFHLVYLAGAVALAALLLVRPTRRQWAALLLAVMVAAGWYAKNRVQYGFFGASSWYGMGLWRTALFGQDEDLLRRLYAGGAFEPVVRVEPFAPPSLYREMGYDKVSKVPLLSRDDMHNVNVPDISAAYWRSALALIRASPGRYARNVLTGYGNFSAPTSMFVHLQPNRARLGWYGELDHWLTGRPLAAAVEARLGGRVYYGSVYYLLFPAVLFLYGWQFLRRPGGWSGLAARVRADAAPFFMAVTVLYVIVVTSMMELGENTRFKFMIEPAFLALAAIVAYRLWAPAPATRSPSGPPSAPPR